MKGGRAFSRTSSIEAQPDTSPFESLRENTMVSLFLALGWVDLPIVLAKLKIGTRSRVAGRTIDGDEDAQRTSRSHMSANPQERFQRKHVAGWDLSCSEQTELCC